ncbi:RNA cytidine acetyltransferase [Parelaphostrongylus tenuis]|uniref:RNA cytidine acetyltransferase n=1 Tax=Parelaphostrongylus tenuis TaxID=148309 RepID=A0AAD5MR01_PARTN|nr:RNA cytidine acetyltransferase [Parelaphostrongylus tenuis]
MRTKIDNRIRILIENGVSKGHRSMFVVVGDRGRDQISVFHHILTKATVTARPTVLWCYKKELGYSSNKKKRIRQIHMKSSVSTISEGDPFEVFISTTKIRYCYYNETHNILGNTYGMLVLQDFEALTPNLLARTIETVEGGGIIVLLMKTVNSLRQLYTIAMDVHNRYRTESHSEIVPRFNERFILSLAGCKDIVVVDDQLNILPISSHISTLERIEPSPKSATSPSEDELKALKESMKDTKPIGPLLSKCRTACQGKALLRLLDVITDKDLNVTCSITAARGRGKSASLGLSLAGAIAFGYSNIFVTSPSPENLRTLFEFVVKGFDTIGYQEHIDYELIQSTNPEFQKALVRVNVFREHRQTIQYIHPSDASKLGQAELVVVDEAAAIPLPLVKELIFGQHIVFLASTINGYEGTGRSLSLKLLQQLRQQSAGSAKGEKLAASRGRKLYELTMEESIRYKPGDEIEQWLNRVLCLNSAKIKTRLSCGTPPPSECELYFVNRDTLFSFHKASEAFLQQVMAIYVAAHYKNSPNDLQMLSDAPAHHLFVLMSPVKEDQSSIPEVLALAQVCLEGNLSKDFVSTSMDRGKRAAGDLLPWTISQQFMDRDFPTLCGGRIVRIAVHPDFQSMGYGTRTLELLEEYYLGHVPSLDENVKESVKTVKDGHTVELLEEQITPRVDLPPLLLRLTERKAEYLDYLGASFGLTLNLLKFWKKRGFVPVYLRQTPSPLTGEYSCIVLKQLHDQSVPSNSWLAAYFVEFRTRLLSLLSFEFRKLPINLGLSLLQVRNKEVNEALKNQRKVINREQLSMFLSNVDLKRLSEFARNLVDHSMITDLLPTVSRLYFGEQLRENVTLSTPQIASLIYLKVRSLPFIQKTIRKLADEFDSMCMDALRNLIPDKTRDIDKEEQLKAVNHLKPLAESLEDDLENAAQEIRERQLRDKKALLEQTEGDLSQYAINVDTKTLAKACDVKMIYSRPIATKRQSRDDDGPSKKRKSFKKKRAQVS